MSYCLSRVSHHFTISTLKVILIVLKNKMQGHFTTQWESLASLTLDFFSCFKKASKWKFPVQVILLAKKYFYRSCILIPPSLILEMLITVVQQKYFCSAPVSRLQNNCVRSNSSVWIIIPLAKYSICWQQVKMLLFQFIASLIWGQVLHHLDCKEHDPDCRRDQGQWGFWSDLTLVPNPNTIILPTL